MIDPTQLLTLSQAAQRRGVTRSVLYYYIRQGRLTPIKMFGKLLVKVSDLDALTPLRPGPRRNK